MCFDQFHYFSLLFSFLTHTHLIPLPTSGIFKIFSVYLLLPVWAWAQGNPLENQQPKHLLDQYEYTHSNELVQFPKTSKKVLFIVGSG